MHPHSHDSNVNPRHSMKGNDAFLIVEYSAYVAPPPPSLIPHPSPIIDKQSVELHISSDECNEINVSGAQNSPFDGTVELFVDIDGERAISITEVKSGWKKWIAIVYSFGIKCDNANHKIEIRVNQWVSGILRVDGRWQEILKDVRTLKFEKTSTKKGESISKKLKTKLKDKFVH